jgi:tetratricopeptide (TPR) repeat protein
MMNPNRHNLLVLAASLTVVFAQIPAVAGQGQGTGDAGSTANIPATRTTVDNSFSEGIAAFKQGDLSAAAAAMEKAVAADPKNAEAQAWYGYLLLRQNNPAAAIPYLETAVSLKPTPDAYTNLGNALLAKPGRTQADTLRAREMFLKTAAAVPDPRRRITT